MDLSPVSKRPHGYAQLVRCPFCGAKTGSPCVTSTGQTAPQAHRRRWDASSRAAAHDTALFAAMVDEPGEWLAGDLLIARAYRYDNEKVTVLRVLPSGRDPQRNAYRSDVEVLRVLTEAEVHEITEADLVEVNGATK